MKTIIFLIAVMAISIAVVAALSKAGKRPPAQIQARPPLTPREQSMFFRLIQAFPGHIVLAQVSLGALLRSRDQATRNRFIQKMADFVVCTKSFEVIAVIELDDASHKGRQGADTARDELLAAAHIRTLRYANVPDPDRLKTDLAPATAA